MKRLRSEHILHRQIQRALRLFEREARRRLQVDHGGPHVAMAQQLLDRLQIVSGDEQMAGEGVTERMRRHALGKLRSDSRSPDGGLHLRFVQMVSPDLLRRRDPREGGGRKEPLPDRLHRRILVLPAELIGQEHATTFSKFERLAVYITRISDLLSSQNSKDTSRESSDFLAMPAATMRNTVAPPKVTPLQDSVQIAVAGYAILA